MRRIICFALALIALLSLAYTGFGEAADHPNHNFIIIIDNSRSTTGRHSLGGATDPSGLRFDAAKLVYENVIYTASTGNRGKMGVIVFCGPENCVSYGPMDIDADPDALQNAIGANLNEKANQGRRDNYTDIRTALQTARDMMDGFTGQTSVILLTDGVNDLTNTADPFNQPENIEANDQSVATISDMRRMGTDVYIIALTAQDAIRNTDAFMAFIDRLAAAGGGKPGADGIYSNVLLATQDDLNSKLLQMLIKAESSTEANIQNFALRTPIEWPFSVPYSGISDATVNITFMPQDKPRIERIELVAPDGTAYTLYDGDGVHAEGGISVTEDRSYFILGIPAPQPGDWRVIISSLRQAELPINTVVRFNANLRLRVALPERFTCGEAAEISVCFQQYHGAEYVDLTDSAIYDLSQATLTVLDPAEDSQPVDISMTSAEGRFTARLTPETAGLWFGAVKVQNDYLMKEVNDLAFEVQPAPTAAPAAQSDDRITVVDDTMIVKTENGDSDFFWQVEADPESNRLTVSWEGNGADGAEAAIQAAGADAPAITGIHSGDEIDLSALDPDVNYTILLTAFSSAEGADGDTPPPIQALDLKLAPDLDDVGDAVLSVIDAAVKIAPTSLSQEQLKDALEAMQQAQKDVDGLVDGVTGEGGASGQSTETAQGGKTGQGGTGGASGASEAGRVDAEPANNAAPFDKIGAGGKGNVVSSGGAGPEIAAPDQQTDAPTAAPQSSPIKGILDAIGNNWMLLGGGVVALMLLGAVAFIIVDRSGEHVSGNLKLQCDPIRLEMLLKFEGRGSLRSGSPITRHPDVAKLKGGKIYDVLSNLTVSMGEADAHGMVEGSEIQHMANEKLLRVTYTDPRSGEAQIIHVGAHDIGDSTLDIYDAGRIYAVTFSGNLSFDETMRN